MVQDRFAGLVSVDRMAGAGDADGGAVGDGGFKQVQVTVADQCAELGFAAEKEGRAAHLCQCPFDVEADLVVQEGVDSSRINSLEFGGRGPGLLDAGLGGPCRSLQRVRASGA